MKPPHIVLPPQSSLRILHVLRAPVGGLFRHVVDLSLEQQKQGHQVGIIADSTQGEARIETRLTELSQQLSLGLHRFPMKRKPHPTDAFTVLKIRRLAQTLHADVLHGHGAKGGLYARFPFAYGGYKSRPLRVYTPHGGSFHYIDDSLEARLYTAVERALERTTDLFLLESAYMQGCFNRAMGETSKPVVVNLNGLYPHEFAPRVLESGATDFFFMGELRHLKGVDVILEALSQLRGQGISASLSIIGAGPDEAQFKAQMQALNLQNQVRFLGSMNAAHAFTKGRIMISASRAESLPYAILEAVAAEIPVLSTQVGGIYEILGEDYRWFIPPANVEAMSHAMQSMLQMPEGALEAAAATLSHACATRFTVEAMARNVSAAYLMAMEKH